MGETPDIVDAHCHVNSERFTPRSFIEASVENTAVMLEAVGMKISRTRLVEQALQGMQDHLADDLVGMMDEAGITETVLLCPDFSYELKDCALTAEEALQAHREIMARHPGRFYTLAGVDPRWGQDGIDLFERAVSRWGFHGLKLYPPCGYSPSDPLLDPFYEICDERGLPVLLHTGPTVPNLNFELARPGLIDAAARRFPRVSFILAHAPVAHTDESLNIAMFRPNVYIDLSGFQLRLKEPGGRLARILHQGILHKILFGTDWPVFNNSASLADSVAAFTDEDGVTCELTRAQRQLILSKNARRLLPPILDLNRGGVP